VEEIEGELRKYGKTYAFHTYDNAGHGFFSVDRPNYRQEAAVEGWKQVFQWYERYLR
jgi:carboxymethylenebutenolidase